jgi:hypothetical protein
MNTVLKLLVALLLIEGALYGGIHAARSVLEMSASIEYWTLYQQEKVQRQFWESKMACAQKLNGCSKLAVERKVRANDGKFQDP